MKNIENVTNQTQYSPIFQPSTQDTSGNPGSSIRGPFTTLPGKAHRDISVSECNIYHAVLHLD